ncbi:MAG TPA: DUF2695 domain-containing protein [Polyangiaceae bacterium]|nr:DUF2695 domain-containing protein [Polyangiaceae bacterium]
MLPPLNGSIVGQTTTWESTAVEGAGMDENQRELKKRWRTNEKAAARAAFPLPGPELAALFDHVEDAIERSGCDHSLRFTASWLEQQRHESESVVTWLRAHGGFCDCEVVANVRDHWEQNRA